MAKAIADFMSIEFGGGGDHGIELFANNVLVEWVKVDNLRAASGLADLLASCNDLSGMAYSNPQGWPSARPSACDL